MVQMVVEACVHAARSVPDYAGSRMQVGSDPKIKIHHPGVSLSQPLLTRA